MQHSKSCQDKQAAGKQLYRVKCRVLQAALKCKPDKCRDCKGSRLLTVVRLMHFDSGINALLQLRSSFTPSAYESAHMQSKGMNCPQ